jgi:hypothetical protein
VKILRQPYCKTRMRPLVKFILKLPGTYGTGVNVGNEND